MPSRLFNLETKTYLISQPGFSDVSYKQPSVEKTPFPHLLIRNKQQMDIDPTLIDPALAGSSSSSPTPNGTSKAHSSTKSNPESKMPLSNTHSHNNQDDDDDPIVATFNILLKPTLPANRRVLILEHPNKSDGRKPARSPMELRVKPATGMVEVDFPIDYNTAYDRTKGLNWGTNLHKNIEAKKGGSHGLAGGFGVGAPPPRAARAGGRGANDDEIFDMGMDWSEALRKDYVLRTQTLGGQTPDVSAESKYMVGVFTGSTSCEPPSHFQLSCSSKFCKR